VLGHDFFELCKQHKKEHVETNKVATYNLGPFL
jgi:hypothetical protein